MTKKRILTLNLLSFFLFPILLGCKKDKTEPPTVAPPLDFELNYGGDNDQSFSSVTVRDSFIYAFGTNAISDGQFYLAKFNLAGTLDFAKTFGGGNKEGKAILPTADGNFILIGNYFNGLDKDIHLLKINPEGNVIWSQDIIEPGNNKANAIVEASNSDLWLVGSEEHLGDGNRDVYLVRLSSDGSVLQEFDFGSEAQESGSDIALMPTGELMIYGMTSSDGPESQDYYLLKVSESGDSLWSFAYGGDGYEEAQELEQTPQGDFIMCGHSASNDHHHNMYCVKVNGDGDIIWEKEYGGLHHDGGQAALINSEGNYVFIARSNSYQDMTQGAYMVTTGVNGNVLRDDYFGSSGDDLIDGVAEFDGAYYLVGRTNSFGSGDYDGYLIRHCLTD